MRQIDYAIECPTRHAKCNRRKTDGERQTQWNAIEDAIVLRHGDRFEVLAENSLDDGFDASPAVAWYELYLRGAKSLYCIAEPL